MIYQGVEMDVRVVAVLAKAAAWVYGGSRAICPEVTTPETDHDFMILPPPIGTVQYDTFLDTLKANGFDERGAVEYDEATKGPDPETRLWVLYTEPKVDMILCDNEVVFERWATAVKVCQVLHLTERKHRVMVHRAIRTGKFFEPKEKEKIDAVHCAEGQTGD